MVDHSLASHRFARITRFEEAEEREQLIARAATPLRVAHIDGRQLSWVIASSHDSREIVWLVGVESESRLKLDHLKPAGASTVEITGEDMKWFDPQCWVQLEAVFTGVEDRPFSDELRDTILALLGDYDFVVDVRLTPTDSSTVGRELASLDGKSNVAGMQSAAAFAKSQTDSEVAGNRYRDLLDARDLGGWETQIFVGASTDAIETVAQLAGTALTMPGVSFRPFNGSSPPTMGVEPSTEFLLSSYQLGILQRPPIRELPGVALGPAMPFDINPESAGHATGDRVELGSVLDTGLQPGSRFGASTATLNRHALICGATGSGKTQTSKQLLAELTRQGIPWLVIEPAKSEYRSMKTRLAEAGYEDAVSVIRLGDPTQVPLCLNPLEPEPGFPLQTHIDMVNALFVAAFSAEDPFPQILNAALRRCYRELGWEIATGDYKQAAYRKTGSSKSPRYPSLEDLQRAAYNVIDEIGYEKEVRGNMLGYVDIRIASLYTGTPGSFFQGGHPLNLARLYQRNTIIEIEDVGNDTDKAFVIGAVILRLYEFLRMQGPQTGLRHVTIVEEAHRLLRRTEPGVKPNQSVELFAAMLSEVRAFGEGIVIAEQIPTKILPDVIKNTALQIVHRLPSAEDRSVLAGATNMNDDQSAYVLSLKPGHAAAFREGMDQPVLLKVDYTPDNDLTETTVTLQDNVSLKTSVRNINCAETCATTSPCAGDVLAANTTFIDNHPILGLWTELVFQALIKGQPVPSHRQNWVTEIDTENINFECAMSELVEDTTAVRWSQLADFYNPADLAKHLYQHAIKPFQPTRPTQETSRFLAGRFIAKQAHYDLSQHIERTESEWPNADRYRNLGLDIPETPPREQLDWVGSSNLWNYIGQHRLITGTPPTSLTKPQNRVQLWVNKVTGGTHDRETSTLTLARVTDNTDVVSSLDSLLDVPTPTPKTAPD